MVSDLTDKQKETLDLIASHISINGVPPTLVELQKLLHVSSNQAVLNHLAALEGKGYIERRKMARGIRLLKTYSESETEGSEFLDLLKDLSTQRSLKKKAKDKFSISDPYQKNENPRKILVAYYNDEQY